MVPILELSFVVPHSNTFLEIFCKKNKILVLSYNLPYFVPILKEIDKKLAQI